MKSLLKITCHLTYKIRLFLLVLFIAFYTLPLSVQAADGNDTAASNPCSAIIDDDKAKASCNHFLENEDAAGPDPSFAQATVVKDTKGLVNAVNNANSKGVIILLHSGTYELDNRLQITGKIALVGIKNGASLPEIRPTATLFNKFLRPSSMVYLNHAGSANPKGFYSAFIKWDTSIDPSETLKQSSINAYGIYGRNYQGVVRLHGNQFTHSNKHDKITLYDLVNLTDPAAPVYIDSNTFDTRHVYYSAVRSNCALCREPDPEIRITFNKLSSDPKAKTSQYGFVIIDFRKFTIEGNTALTPEVNASMKIHLPDKAGLNASIKNNIAHQSASETYRNIKIRKERNFGKASKIGGNLEVTGNDYYDVDHDVDDGAYLTLNEGKEVPKASPATRVPTPMPAVVRNNPCELIEVKDPTKVTDKNAAKKSCNDFFNNQKAAGDRSSFATAVVVTTAGQLHDAIYNADDNGTIIVLGAGVYHLPDKLFITNRIALVGTRQDDADASLLSTIKMTKELLDQDYDLYSLVYLSDLLVPPINGFYSAYIKWDTAVDSDVSDGSLVVSAIDNKYYEGEFRLYGNNFTHHNGQNTLSDFIYLDPPAGRVYIGYNTFETDEALYSAVYSNCNGCDKSDPEVIIEFNKTTSKVQATDEEFAYRLSGHSNFRINNNTQATSQAFGNIKIGLPNKENLRGVIENNVAHADAPSDQRMIHAEVHLDKGDEDRITGNLKVLRNDYFVFDHSGLNTKLLTLIPGKRVPEKPTLRPPTRPAPATPAVTVNPCKALTDDTARTACNRFLENPEATGNDKQFSHAFSVKSTKELFNAIEAKNSDGKPFAGSIVLLHPGTYELSVPLKINHKVALVGIETAGSRPKITTGKGLLKGVLSLNAMVDLRDHSSETASGFFSTRIHWEINTGKAFGKARLNSVIGDSITYNGDVRIYDNQFHYNGPRSQLDGYINFANVQGKMFIGNNTFNTDNLRFFAISGHCLINCDRPEVEIVSNKFTTQKDSETAPADEEAVTALAIRITGYNRFQIDRNRQKTTKASAFIRVTLKDNTTTLKGYIRNNVAHKQAPEHKREILVRVPRLVSQPVNVSGQLIISKNDYYRLEKAGVPDGLITFIEGKTAKSVPNRPTPPATKAAITESSLTTTEPTNPDCSLISDSREAQNCNDFENSLKKLKIDTTFAERVAVKNRDELVREIKASNDSGKMILLYQGTYELDEPLPIRSKVALVGMGDTIIKSAYSFYSTEPGNLVLLNNDVTSHGFYSGGITWDISFGDNPRGKPFGSAIKAIDYPGEMVILDNNFQHDATENNEDAPSRYIDVQKSTGNVLIAENTFFTQGLKESAVYANCKECLKDNQYIRVAGNRFSNTDKTEEIGSTVPAIDIQYYKNLDIHRNIQETTFATGRINVVLPNSQDDINAVIRDNLAQAASDEQSKTIELSVGRLSEEPVSIGGSVNVFDNQCYTVSENDIPGNILSLKEGRCYNNASASASVQFQKGGGSSTSEILSYVIPPSLFAFYGLTVFATYMFGRCGSESSMKAYKTLIMPVKLVGSAVYSCYSSICGHKGYDQSSHIGWTKGNEAFDN